MADSGSGGSEGQGEGEGEGDSGGKVAMDIIEHGIKRA